LTVFLARLLGKKTVVKVAGSGYSGNVATLRRRWLGWLALNLLRKADRLISLCGEITAELLENRFDAARIVSIPNGVDLKRFTIDHSDSPRATDALVVTAVGRLEREKGFDLLIRGWAKVAGRFPGARLLFLGEGADRSELERMARELGVGERVDFLGESADVPRYLADSDIFVLPSRGEGMSNALLEAMASGLACLASDISANSGVITTGLDGVLFRTEDPNDLATKLEQLLEDEALRRRLGAKARQSVQDRFSIESVVVRYDELYRALLHG
jgi:glycosyltransferase involved in cell wall biosynthesis